MIIQFILKHWRKVFDLLLVIAIAVAAYFFFTKFMFGTKTKLNDTANMVSSIKNIGELVTAEYYGEVIASLEETEYDLISIDSLDQIAYDWYIEIKFKINDIYEDDLKRSARKDSLNALAKQLIAENNNSKNDYINFINYLRNELSIGRYRGNKNHENLKEIIDYLYKEILKNNKKLSEEELNNYLFEGAYRTQTFSEYRKAEAKEKIGRKELSIIGRGWVKAGFNFEKVNEKNFHYDKDRKEIHLIGFETKILDADINPWFIPENKIPGFDIIASKGKVSFKDAQKVKLKCVDKLEKKALDANILENATQFGKEGLEAFFSLLTGEEVKVIFHSNQLDQLFDIISRDTLITFDEANLIVKNVNEQIKEIIKAKEDSIKDELIHKKEILLTDFIQKLKKLNYGNKTWNCKFNYYLAATNNIIKTQTIIIDQTKQIDNLKDSSWRDDTGLLNNIRFKIYKINISSTDSAKLDTVFHYPEKIKTENLNYWFGNDSLSFMADYNNFITLFNTRDNIIKIRKDKLLAKNEVFDTTGNKKFITRINKNPKDVVLYYEIKKSIDYLPLKQYLYTHASLENKFEVINTNYLPNSNLLAYEHAAIQSYQMIKTEIYNNRGAKEKLREWALNMRSGKKEKIDSLRFNIKKFVRN